jgi:hypothetical protein
MSDTPPRNRTKRSRPARALIPPPLDFSRSSQQTLRGSGGSFILPRLASPMADRARARRLVSRRAPGWAALAAFALLTAACGGGSPDGTRAQPGSSTTPAASAQGDGALAFSHCMRSHGVSTFADPSGNGELAKETPAQLGVSRTRFETAQGACQRLLPNAGQPTPAALQRSWRDFRIFAHCMRDHGIAVWPDPTRYAQHPERPTFDLQAVGIDPSAPHIRRTIRACEPLLRGANPQRLGEGGP